jgi:hypothetical protein
MALRRLLILVAALASICRVAAAQTVTGTISGTVMDQSDAIVPNAGVTLLNDETGASRKTTTGDSGEFVFTAVPPGNYTVVVEAAGFQSTRITGVILPAGLRLALGKVQLVVGQATQSIAVTAERERISTENADVSNRVNQRQFSELTIKGRDPLALIRTMPGVTTGLFVNGGEKSETDPDGLSSNGGIYGSLTPNISGGRMFWNTVTVDGQVSGNPDWPGLMMSAVSVEAVAEMKVTTSNFTAEYGRNLGSNVTMVTRSGTRDFHGSGYWFKRHEGFNARDFFNNRNALPKPVYRYNTLGFTVGGPIYIPKRLNTSREKLFFFYSQEEWRTKIPIDPFFLTVPTDRERSGDFSQTLDQSGALVPITDPTTRQPFPGNMIPASRINRDGQVLLNVIPLPNQLDRGITKGAYNYQWQDVCTDPKRLQGLKTDYVPGNSDRFSLGLRRWWSDVRAYTCITLGYSGLPLMQHHYNYTTDNALLNWTHVFGATATNEFSIGVVGEKERGPVPGPYPERAETYFDAVKRSKVGYTLGQFYGAGNPFGLIPQASFGGVPNAANIAHDARLPGDQGYSRFSFADRYSWVRGRHTFKFGVDFEWNFANDGPASTCGDGCFDFGRNPNNPLDSNWAYSNALLGSFATYTETNNRPKYRYERKNWEFFAQDTWKVNRRLTLNYGMRFAAFTNWDLTIGNGAGFVLEDYSRARQSPLFQPAFDSSGRRVARDPVSGQLFPAVYIGAFVPGVGEPFFGDFADESGTAVFHEWSAVAGDAAVRVRLGSGGRWQDGNPWRFWCDETESAHLRFGGTHRTKRPGTTESSGVLRKHGHTFQFLGRAFPEQYGHIPPRLQDTQHVQLQPGDSALLRLNHGAGCLVCRQPWSPSIANNEYQRPALWSTLPYRIPGFHYGPAAPGCLPASLSRLSKHHNARLLRRLQLQRPSGKCQPPHDARVADRRLIYVGKKPGYRERRE